MTLTPAPAHIEWHAGLFGSGRFCYPDPLHKIVELPAFRSVPPSYVVEGFADPLSWVRVSWTETHPTLEAALAATVGR